MVRTYRAGCLAVAAVLLAWCGSASAQVIDWTGTVTGSPSISGNVPVTLAAGSYRVYFDINYNSNNPVDFGVNGTGGTGYVYTSGAALSYAWGNLTVGTGGVTTTWPPYENLPGGGYTMHVKVYQVSVTTKTYMGANGRYNAIDSAAIGVGTWGAWSSSSTDFNSLMSLIGSGVVDGKIIQIETTATSLEVFSWRSRVLAYDPLLPPPPPPGGGGGGSPRSGDFYIRTDDDQCPAATALSDYTYQGRNYAAWLQLADPNDIYWHYTLDAVIAENPKYLFFGEVPFIGFYWYGAGRKDCGGGGGGGGGDCCECMTQVQFEDSLNKWITRTEVAKLLSDTDAIKTNTANISTKINTLVQRSDEELQRNYTEYTDQMTQMSTPSPTLAEPDHGSPEMSVPRPSQSTGAFKSVLMEKASPLQYQTSSNPAPLSIVFPSTDLGYGITFPGFSFTDDESHLGELWETWEFWRVAFRTGQLAVVSFSAMLYLMYLTIQWVPE